jgi:hypothetical protein
MCNIHSFIPLKFVPTHAVLYDTSLLAGDLSHIYIQLDNGSFSGALGDLIAKRADFMANACFVKDYLTDNRLEFTNAINDDKLCIVVRTAALVCMVRKEDRGEGRRGKNNKCF